MMGGRTWAKNRPEGGAEFGFSLPVYPDEIEPGYDEPLQPAPKAATNGTATAAGTNGTNGTHDTNGAEVEAKSAKGSKTATPA